MTSSYMNLFLDAGITEARDQASYSRRLDAVLAQERIAVDNIIGLGERGTGSNLDLYVVHRQAITLASERGVFNKRVEVKKICPIASIARLRGTQEGYKGREITITAHDADGGTLAKIMWSLSGPDWVEPLVLRQREHLFRVISAAMDRLSETRSPVPGDSAQSQADALISWSADVVKAAGVELDQECVEEHANMIAAGIRIDVFMPLGRVDDLGDFYPDGEMPDDDPITTFDDLYAHVVERVGDPATVDRNIKEYLAASWNTFVQGCRDAYA